MFSSLQFTGWCIYVIYLISELVLVLADEAYIGLPLGKLNTYAHQVSGQVYAVDEYTLLIRNFFYDGLGQDTFFWAGATVRPSNIGFIVPDEEGKTNRLQRYVNADVTLRLPDNRKLSTVKWLAVWDLRDHNNLADVYIPEGLEAPSPQMISELSRNSHGVQCEGVVVQDSKTITILNLQYNGNDSDVFFWVGVGPQPTPFGTKVPDENGYLNGLTPYSGKDVHLLLPGKMTMDDVDWLSIYNIRTQENYGSTVIPDKLNIPPSLIHIIEVESPLPNCEQLHRDFRLSWEIFGPAITFELAGQIAEDEYMALGISGSENSSQMIGSDVAVCYMDGLLGTAADYNISGKFPCSNVLGKNGGVCLDEKVGGVANAYQIHTYVRNNGITTLTYRRNLLNTEDTGDKVFNQEGDTYMVWAIGKYNRFREPTYHRLVLRGDLKLNLGRKPGEKNCVPFSRPRSQPVIKSWGPLRIRDPQITTFTVRVGVPGNIKGYHGITGRSSPGVAWYVNGLLSPELYLRRNRRYTFIVEGGNEPYDARFYHPFYITDDSHGGYGKYTEEERQGKKIYAGVEFDRRGRPHPSVAGRLCAWVHNSSHRYSDDDFPTFPKFRKTLKLECAEGEPSILHWTPNATVPDLLYYQSYSQSDMGWKIFIVDEIINAATATFPFSLTTSILCAFIVCLCTHLNRIF
ncbi:protein Skeletor, isoforms B/C [Parasteatoda tepidariorum]|uniref:protein Skeletor, isoforms B/C n=1 Tax=Parasteatoda tepidariorum TaxID=114398 RepID=UPI001C727BF1|nr:protein Skeletor, isoforms B/C [Parasteatoda tepidariorum]